MSEQINTGETTLTWRKPITENAPPKARGGHVTMLVNTDLIVFGGHCSSGSGSFTYFDDTYALNLENNTWHKVQVGGDIPPPRYGHTASLVGERIYVFGGRGEEGVVYKDIHFLDTERWCWIRVSSTTSRMPTARFAHASAVVGNKIVIHGGWNGKECYDDFWIFDTSSLAWMKPRIGGQVPKARQGHVLELTADGRILIFGGLRFNDQHIPVYLNDVRSLDIETMVWTTPRVKADRYPAGRYMHSSCMVGTYLFTFGGYTGPVKNVSDRISILVPTEHPVKEDYVIALDTEKMEWVRPNNVGKLPVSRYGHTMVAAGPQVVIFGGWGANRALNDICVAEAFGAMADTVEYEEGEAPGGEDVQGDLEQKQE